MTKELLFAQSLMLLKQKQHDVNQQVLNLLEQYNKANETKMAIHELIKGIEDYIKVRK